MYRGMSGCPVGFGFATMRNAEEVFEFHRRHSDWIRNALKAVQAGHLRMTIIDRSGDRL